MNQARRIALNAIGGVLGGTTSPRALLEGAGRELSKRDRALFMELTYGVLRKLYLLDWVLARFLKKPGGLGTRTTNNLRLGTYQILMTRVPEWAAVSEAVALEKKSPALVNAVLRNLLRERDSVEAEMKALSAAAQDPKTPRKERTRAIATTLSYPIWLIRRWIERFGAEEAYALAEAGNRIPPLTLRTNTLAISREELLSEIGQKGYEAEPTSHSPEGIKLAGTLGRDEIKALIGKAYVQDEGAQLVSRLLEPRGGERVLDACSAPGGKATHLAQLMSDRGRIIALERDPARAQRLEENIKALGLKSIRVVTEDLLKYVDETGDGFDRVMLDAPCSSLGVIRRNPDVKYRHREDGLARFGQIQLGLLTAASKHLRPGGLLVYSTCSTEPEEGEMVIDEFLKTWGDSFTIEGVPGTIEGVPGKTELVHRRCEFLRTYPHKEDMDAFFAARLRKNR